MTVGIMGGGQLGRMLALAGLPLGLTFRFWEQRAESVQGLGEIVSGPFDDPRARAEFCHGLTVATLEFENVPVATARAVAEQVRLFPPPEALEVSQDRLVEKRFLQSLGIPVAEFRPIDGPEDLKAADFGPQAILKTRRMGYDGRGQYRLDDLPPSLENLILERFVPFQRECSMVGVRSSTGQIDTYPLVQTIHHRGILVRSQVPPDPSPNPALTATARSYLERILTHLDYVGVLALEMFECEGHLIANEMAPRVHNSGHWTQDGALTSQFENHLRAGLGWPLGSCALRAPTTMVNLLGTVPELAPLLAIEGLHVHLYGKSPRQGRKLGHLNLVGAAQEAAGQLLKEVCEVG